MKNVYPDVILFPLFGTNASMWQEIGERIRARRDVFASQL